MLLVFCSMLTVSIVLFGFSVSNAENDRMDQIKKTLDNAANMSLYTIGNAVYADAIYSRSLAILANNLDAHIVVADLSGRITCCSEQVFCTVFENGYMPKEVMDVLRSTGAYSNYANVGPFGAYFDTPTIVEGIPLYRVATDIIGGGIFIFVPTSSYSRFSQTVFLMLLCSTVIALVASAAVLRSVLKKELRPLSMLSESAKKIGKGDYVKLPVTSNDEIGELISSFNEMSEAISQLEDARRTFVADVSHELRTPMTSIRGFVEGVLDGTIPAELQQKYLTIVRDEMARLSRLISQLLEISRLKAGTTPLNYSEFDVHDMIEQISLLFAHSIEEKKLQYSFDMSSDYVQVSADSDLIYRVIYNLLDNAVKFSYDGGMVWVKVADIGDRLRIRIGNTGKGISKEDMEHIFERFYKADRSRGLDKSGMGLGLYHVKTIIERHGQNISVSGKEGNYVEFEFTLKMIKP